MKEALDIDRYILYSTINKYMSKRRSMLNASRPLVGSMGDRRKDKMNAHMERALSLPNDRHSAAPLVIQSPTSRFPFDNQGRPVMERIKNQRKMEEDPCVV